MIARWLVLAALLVLPLAAKVIPISTPDGGAVPDAEVDDQGAIHLAYVRGEDAFYRRSTDDGKSWSEPLRINSDAGTVHPANTFRGPDLALGKEGRVHVIWYANSYQRKRPQNEWGVNYAQLDPGTKAFSAARNLNHRPSDNYSLAANGKGAVAVVWMAEKLYVTESSDNGASFGKASEVAVADPCECCASRAAFASDTSLLISYREKANNERDMHLLKRGRHGGWAPIKTDSPTWNLPACPMTGTYLVSARGGALMGWETKGQIYFGREAKIIKGTRVTEKGKYPVVLPGADGSILVSWKNDSNLEWQVFGANGEPLDKMVSKPSSTNTRHAGATTRDGNFLLID